MKILHVTAPAPWGGLESVLYGLVSAQAEAGHDVSVIAAVESDRHDFVVNLRARGLVVVPLTVPPRAYREERRQITSCCVRRQPDVVHTHGYRPDVIAGGAARSLGVPWVTTVHGFTGGGWKNRFYERLQLLSYRHCSAVVAVSDRLSAELAERGVPRSRLHMVRNGWPGEPAPLPRSDARARLGITSDAPRIGWIGRMSREKGADVLIQSLPALRTTGLRASMVGDGVERPPLESLARELGVTDMIDWHGPIADAGAVCPAFDVFVMSSRTEGTPIVLLEAMAAGVPVVATAVGGVPAVLGTDGGLLVPSESPDQLAHAIQLTVTDRTAASARAQVSLARARGEFGMARTAEAYDRVYESVIHGLKTAHA